MRLFRRPLPALLFSNWLFILLLASGLPAQTHSVPPEHPRLLGDIGRLRALAGERPDAYARTEAVARAGTAGDHELMISMALVSVIEQDSALARQAIAKAMEYAEGPIRSGHVTFGHDLARCAVVYDFCHEWWTEAEKEKFHEYFNATVDANVNSETSAMHNGWYGYKHWGIGLGCYAAWYENSRAPEIMDRLKRDYENLAVPALELAGEGGGWAEGYYVNYWTYEWVFFCEAARFCEGWDIYETAPSFYRNRAVAAMFETYPGIKIYNSRRSIPMGDGGGRVYGGDRDKVLATRRILASRYRDDPAHQAVHTFNETTPRSASGTYAYKDLLWRDTSVEKGPLGSFRLSYHSPGPGYVYARSSWEEDATYFYFKCGDRFTSHQHLDNGHFLIYKHEELAGDGGHYDSFGSNHDVNYHLRTIAHSTILINDPTETWPAIRAGNVTVNDGGQHHDWPHHNGTVQDADEWRGNKGLYDIADILALQDRGSYLYVAGDCSGAYNPVKLEYFTRQIVFLRPNTFVIFDRVKGKDPTDKKIWQLQAMKPPTGEAPNLVITNGRGRLFMQTVLPERQWTTLASGDELYSCDGYTYPPSRDTGPAPECRVQVSPIGYSTETLFLHVLTAADSTVDEVPRAELVRSDSLVTVELDGVQLEFCTTEVNLSVSFAGSGVPGDVNGDGELGMDDLLSVIRLAVGAREGTQAELHAADVSGDGRVDLVDVIRCLIRMKGM